MAKEKIIKICDYIIEYGFLAMVFLTPILFDFTLSNYNAFDLFKMVIFRIILSLVLAAYIAKIFVQGKISCRGSNKIFLLAFLMLASFFISSLLSIHPNLSFWGSYERQQGFYNLANYLLFFVLLILNFHSLKQIKRLIIAAVMSGALVCLYGLAQLFGLDPLPWKESGFSTGRIFSSLGQPNFFGQYLALILPLSFYGLFFIVKKFLTRFLVGLVIFIEFICLLNTYSRAAWLAFLASAIFFIMIFLALKKQKNLALAFGVFLLMGAALVLSLNYFSSGNLSGPSQLNAINRLKSITDLRGGSNRMRLYYWQAAGQEIKQADYKRLLAGYGPDTLATVFVKYYRPDWAIYETINTYNDRAHNWLFEVILSYGFLGLGAILLFYVYLIFKAAKFLFGQDVKSAEEIWLAVALAASLIAYSINNLFSFSLFTGYVYLYFIIASLWFLAAGREVKAVQLKLTMASKILIWFIAATVAGLFIYSENINLVKADYFYLKAKKAEKGGDCQGLLDNLVRAVNYDANSVYYKEQYIFHGLNCFSAVLTKDGQLALRDNIEAQISAIKPEEFQYVNRLTVARAYSLFGFYIDQAYYQEAEKIFNNLIANNPYLLTSYQDLGRIKMWQKDYAGAINLFKQAESFLPRLNNPLLDQRHTKEIQTEAVSLYEKMGFSYNKLKDYKSAADYYKKALALNPYQATLYKGLADTYYLQGQLDQTVVLNQRGLMLNPADYHWYLSLSLLYRDKKDLPTAKRYLNQAMKLASDNEELRNYYKELNK